MIVDALGNPLALSLTGGNAHDIKLLNAWRTKSAALRHVLENQHVRRVQFQ